MLDLIKHQLLRLKGNQAHNVNADTLISYVLDSRSFLTLLVNLESDLHFTVSDEAFYEAAPITFGQLAEFLHSESAKGEKALVANG
jgi:acyl carrier protein